MSKIEERVSKKGELSYKLRVSCGYDSKGKQRTKCQTWHAEPGMSKRQARKEAERQFIIFEDEVKKDLTVKKIKFKVLAEEWFKLVSETQKLNKSTVATYVSLKERVYNAIGDKYIDEITYRIVQNFILSLSKQGANLTTGGGLSGKTQKHFLSLISNVMKYAIKCGIISENPCKDVEIVKTSKKDITAYTLEEESAIIAALDNEVVPFKYKVFFHLLIFYGLRRSEALGLEWKDFDFKNHLLSIKRTSQYRNGSTGTYTSVPKTKSSHRTLKISNETIALLEEYKRYQEIDKINSGDLWEEHDRLFTQTFGKPMQPDQPYK